MTIQKLNNKGNIYPQGVPFTQVSNHVIDNIDNPLAGFVWIYLLSKSNNWTVIKQQIKNHFKIGNGKIKSIFSYLAKHNLIRNHAIRQKDGKISHYDIEVLNGVDFIKYESNHEHDSSGSKISPPDNPSTCFQPTTKERKRLLNKEYINKKEILEIIEDGESVREEEEESIVEQKKNVRPKAKGTSIDPQFLPNLRHKDIALELKVHVERERIKFIDHYLSNGKTMKDWDAAFRNWLRKASEYKSSRPNRKSHAEIVEDSIRELRESCGNSEDDLIALELLTF